MWPNFGRYYKSPILHLYITKTLSRALSAKRVSVLIFKSNAAFFPHYSMKSIYLLYSLLVVQNHLRLCILSLLLFCEFYIRSPSLNASAVFKSQAKTSKYEKSRNQDQFKKFL